MCFTPFAKRNKITNRTESVPCGKCPQCISRRINGWAFRLSQEQNVSETAYFITLTYDTLHVPINKAGLMDLSKRDLQLFFKRLRKNHWECARNHNTRNPNIKYYAVGEYGGRTHRPHYHIILFNAQLELIQPSWDKGQVDYGQVETASIMYTLKYMEKKNYKPSKEWLKTKFGGSYELYKEKYTEPEFSLMSKKLGISYLTKAKMQWHHSKRLDRMYIPIEDGKKISLPRYYREKLHLTETERRQIKYHKKEISEKLLQKEMEIHGLAYFRDKAEMHRQKFENMHIRAIKKRYKI